MSSVYMGKFDVSYGTIKPEELDLSSITLADIRASLEACDSLRGSVVYNDNKNVARAAVDSGRDYSEFDVKEKIACLLVFLANKHYIADQTKHLADQAG